MHVHVDETRRDDRAGGVEHALAFIGFEMLADLGDDSVSDPHVADGIQRRDGIDDSAARDEKRRHENAYRTPRVNEQIQDGHANGHAVVHLTRVAPARKVQDGIVELHSAIVRTWVHDDRPLYAINAAGG